MENKSEKTRRLVEKIDELLKKSVADKVFPGGVVGISNFNNNLRESLFFSFGSKSYSSANKINKYSVYYDIASLTKPLSTTLAILVLIKKNAIKLESKLEDLLEIEIKDDKKNINLYSLLNHTSGFPAYKPYYKDFIATNHDKGSYDILKKIITEPLEYEPFKKQLYSDLGFILLGKIVEKKADMNLAQFSEKFIYKPLGIEKNIFFNAHKSNDNCLFAPTENCAWRDKILCGEVHDDNAYALGGVCGHAGLFANIFGVMDIVNIIADVVNGKDEISAIKREDLIKFVRRQNDVGSWGLGFDTPSEFSSSGKFFSKNSFGHLGFTGTSFWVDLEKGISIVLLTNRVHPGRDNDKIKKFRPIFHDLIMSSLLE